MDNPLTDWRYGPLVDMFIYTLSHPDTKEVVYVGSTYLPESRKYAHKKRYSFIPVFEILEVIKNVRTGDRMGVYETETYWIHQFKAWGFKLTNINYTK